MSARRASWCLLALCLAAPSVAFAQGAESEAGDVSEVDKDSLGPLRERVRPVSGHVFLKKNRFEFTPSATFSVKDAFYTKYILGASLAFHINEHFALQGRFGYSIPVVSGAAQICETGTNGGLSGCRLPTDAELDRRAQGRMGLVAGGELQWAPIYGKVSLVAEQFLHFDMYAIGGASAVQYRGPAGDTMTVGGTVGVGARFFTNRWISIRTEIRDLIYPESVEGGGTSFRNQFLVDLGVSLFFPLDFKEG